MRFLGPSSIVGTLYYDPQWKLLGKTGGCVPAKFLLASIHTQQKLGIFSLPVSLDWPIFYRVLTTIDRC